jgi:hypothetical protein
MSSSRLRLKHEKGWFAAGAEVENALMTLSDGAFKLFVHLCLLAPRETGIIETSQTELARNLKKGNYTIRKYLQEMQQAGVCRLSGFAPVPYSRGRIEIADEYWPYYGQQTPSKNTTVNESVDQVRQLLQERSCVRTSFSTADEILARQWLDAGTSLERIEQVILLGCTRKYVAWRNHHDSTPIASLRYFEPLLEEINRLQISPDYWSYVRSRMLRLEKLWVKSRRQKVQGEAET